VNSKATRLYTYSLLSVLLFVLVHLATRRRNPPRVLRFYCAEQGKLREKLNYMHRNPVQRRLVRHPRDGPWSSWSHYEKGEPEPNKIDTLREEKDPALIGNCQKRQIPHPL